MAKKKGAQKEKAKEKGKRKLSMVAKKPQSEEALPKR